VRRSSRGSCSCFQTIFNAAPLDRHTLLQQTGEGRCTAQGIAHAARRGAQNVVDSPRAHPDDADLTLGRRHVWCAVGKAPRDAALFRDVGVGGTIHSLGKLRPIKRAGALDYPDLNPAPVLPAISPFHYRVQTPIRLLCVASAVCRPTSPRTFRLCTNLPEPARTSGRAHAPTRPRTKEGRRAHSSSAPTTRGGARHALMELVVQDSPLAEYLEGPRRPARV
jgi:hypothetical protein